MTQNNQPYLEQDLEDCLQSLRQLLIIRLKRLAGQEINENVKVSTDALGRVFLPFLPEKQFNSYDGLLLTLALIPHIRPHWFDRIIQEVFPQGGSLPELGGLKKNQYRCFLPTGFTALYLLGGDDLALRFKVQELLSPDYWLFKTQILKLGLPEPGAPSLSGQLLIDSELVEKIILGRISMPAFSSAFPATHLTTSQTWEDLILPASTQNQIQDILIWLTHNPTLINDWKLYEKFKPGYRALFHGPSGTGKTLTATLLGKYAKQEVFKVDLSTVVSKYIGETEKNLSNLFDRAENKNWILFFDEADALFGKRTQVQNAHDRYANQEVSYLLQRVEHFNGLVILATNLKSNIDEAFLRRFQSLIYFPKPKSHERLQLWKKMLPEQIHLKADIDISSIAQRFDLTGADIINIVQYVCLQTLAQKKEMVSKELLLECIQKEQMKSVK